MAKQVSGRMLVNAAGSNPGHAKVQPEAIFPQKKQCFNAKYTYRSYCMKSDRYLKHSNSPPCQKTQVSRKCEKYTNIHPYCLFCEGGPLSFHRYCASGALRMAVVPCESINTLCFLTMYKKTHTSYYYFCHRYYSDFQKFRIQFRRHVSLIALF